METKIKLDFTEIQSLMSMLKHGANHHRGLAIQERNSIDSITHIMHADTFDKLFESLAIRVKKNERKRAFTLNITLSTAECFSIAKGILPPMNNSYNDMVKYRIMDAIMQSCFDAIAFYSSFMDIQHQQRLNNSNNQFLGT